MWTLLRKINLTPTRRRVARPLVVAAFLVGTGTQVALALLARPNAAGPASGRAAVTDFSNVHGNTDSMNADRLPSA